MTIYNFTDTWDDGATTFNGIKLNVTDTASAADSKLLDLQVGGATQSAFSKNGSLQVKDGSFIGGTSDNSGWVPVAGGTTMDWYRSGAAIVRFGSRANFRESIALGISAFVSDTVVARDAANVLALKNGTNAQEFRVYNTETTVGVDNEYLTLDWDTNVAEIKTVANGTGTARNLAISASGNVLISSLPTSNPGPGILWNNAGTPAIGT